MIDLRCPQSEGRGPDVEQHVLDRSILSSILFTCILLIPNCGLKAGASQDPVEPAEVVLGGTQDECPGEPEDFDGFEDGDGCPDPDNDNDRIPDSEDLCPNDAENYNAVDDEDGCPDMSCQLKIQAPIYLDSQRIYFQKGSAELSEGSMLVVEDLAKVMRVEQLPWKLLVLGHAVKDEAGKDHGLKLSKDRAGTVAGYLAKENVPSENLITDGIGVTCHSESDDADIQRRVEFKLLLTQEGCTNIQIACEEAFENGRIPEAVLEYMPDGKQCTEK